ncbi:hypothetical protein N7467_000380 [Penicillium canescens]|nr:hypothetical protein N7467_000380 [Penicillium canescens]
MSNCACSRRKASSALKLHKGNRDAAVKSLQDSVLITSPWSSTLPIAEQSLDPTKFPKYPREIPSQNDSPKPPIPVPARHSEISTLVQIQNTFVNKGQALGDGQVPTPPLPGYRLDPSVTTATGVPTASETQEGPSVELSSEELYHDPAKEPGIAIRDGTWDFELPTVEIPAGEPHFSPDEGRRLPFSSVRLISSLGRTLQGANVSHYLSFFDEEVVRRGLGSNICGVPSIFYAAATNDENAIRAWLSYGADVNAREPKTGIPLLAFVILRTLATNQDSTSILMTLLSLGADASLIPRDLYSPCIEDPVAKLPFDERYRGFNEPKTSWCKDAVAEQMARAINLSQRYFLEKVSQTKAPSGRQSQVTRVHNATSLLGISHFLVGQSSATRTVSEVLISHLALPRSKPLVMAFTGPSGHGKTELAKRMGELLNLDIQCVDCTEMKHETDLFGPKKPYIGHELGSPLNNFLARSSGRRSIVFLDEFEKTTREVQNALLVPFSEGRYSDRRNRQDVDSSQTIWIFATNAADEIILDFFEIHKYELMEDDHVRRSELTFNLTSSIKKQLKSTFGNPLSGRISVVVPFLPFSLVEAAVVAHKFVLELKRRVLQSVKTSAKKLVGHIVLELRGDGAICKAIAEEGYDCDQGARSLQSSVESRIGDLLVRTYLEEEEQIDDSLPLMRYTVFLTRNGNMVVRKRMGPIQDREEPYEGPNQEKEKEKDIDNLNAQKGQENQEMQKKESEQDEINDIDDADFPMLNLLWHINKNK